MTNKPFSEIIESSLTHWLAQNWQWDALIPFGSIVQVTHQQTTLYGVVSQINTGTMDPVRYPFPYKKDLEQLKREQPQIFEFLKTTINCIPLAYKYKGSIVYQLPGTPPPIHSFVSSVCMDDIKDLLSSERYLHVLFSSVQQGSNLDELILALIRQQIELKMFTGERIDRFASTFSLLVGNDYRRLKLFLQRVEPML